MEEREFRENAAKVMKTDKPLYEAILDEYAADPYASWDILKNRAGVKLGRVADVYAERRAPSLSDAFGLDSKAMLGLIDQDSDRSWLTLPSAELQKAAINAGYMKAPTGADDEATRQANREGFNKFLRVLATESSNRARAKAVQEYENTKFTDSPVEWAKKQVNDILFRTYSKRAREQALRGEGATSFGDMGAGDAATLGLDVMANSLYGAGAGGIAKGVARGGLRGGANLLGSDFAAGVLGGLTDAYNREAHTRAGILPYEWVTEPVVAGIANSVMAPGSLRQAAANVMGFMGGGKAGSISKRGVMKKTGDVLAAETGWPEANLASTLEDLAAAPKYGEAPMAKETAKKVQEMADIWNDGLTVAPGEEQSLFDGLQALYEASFKDGKPPSNLEFSNIVGQEADRLASAFETAGANEARQLRRETEYYLNTKKMLDNGIMDAEEMLLETNPQKFPVKNPVSGETAGMVFDMKGPGYRDEMVMRQYAGDVQGGRPIPARSEEIMDLSRRYPEFGQYVDYVDKRTVFRNGQPVMYGSTFLPPKNITNGEFARGVLGGLEYAAKPAVTDIAMSRYMKEDDSPEAITMAFEKLMEEKPEATRAAYEWKFNPDLPGASQLTPAERELVDRYRTMEQARALGISAK